MLPDRVSNPGPLTYESGALPIALRGPATCLGKGCLCSLLCVSFVNVYQFMSVRLSLLGSRVRCGT